MKEIDSAPPKGVIIVPDVIRDEVFLEIVAKWKIEMEKNEPLVLTVASEELIGWKR